MTLSTMYDRYSDLSRTIPSEGIRMRKPPVVVAPNEENLAFEIADWSIRLTDGLHAFLSSLSMVKISWHLAPGSALARALEADAWIRSNYLDQGYSFSFLEELFSGDMAYLDLGSMILENRAPDAGYKGALQYCKIDGQPVDVGAFYPFEYHWGVVALVRKGASGALSDRVWLLQQEQDPWIVDMNVTLAQYVELAYRARGFHHWQLAYLNRNDPTFARMKFALPKMFPTATFGESIFESSP
ncbi:hypothetical protein [Nannocystis radixulma]|uniref:Uncharacterized protein n=1 Tax=Nannocystis radixulma TaxID=2995305 RepID=A0ABT5BPK4_9BACT|nr:hypothetical protein [Nannocystis radixulma]MDC0675323.1 hypothetical protein [Nannocystis radixulma]